MSRLTALLTRYGLGVLARKYPDRPSMLIYSNDFIGADIMAYGGYEKEYQECLLRSLDFEPHSTVAIDVGANIGTHSRKLANSFKHVYAFEPLPQNFKVLEINTNGFENVTRFPFGISSEAKEVPLFWNPRNMGGASVVKSKRHNQETVVKVQPLEPSGFENVALIKIDVEGHELEALRGLTALIQKHRPILSIECNFRSVINTELLDQIRELGYSNIGIPQIKNLTGAVAPSFPNELLSSLLFSKTARLKQVVRLKEVNYPMVIFTHPESAYQLKMQL